MTTREQLKVVYPQLSVALGRAPTLGELSARLGVSKQRMSQLCRSESLVTTACNSLKLATQRHERSVLRLADACQFLVENPGKKYADAARLIGVHYQVVAQTMMYAGLSQPGQRAVAMRTTDRTAIQQLLVSGQPAKELAQSFDVSVGTVLAMRRGLAVRTELLRRGVVLPV